MDRLIGHACRALEALMALLMLVMLVLVFGNVVLRYAFSTGITISEELSRWLFVWMVFIGSTVAVKERAHLGSDLVIERLPRGARRLCLIVAEAAMVYLSWLLLQGGWAQMQLNVDVQAQVSGLSLRWFYLSGVVFAVLSGLLWLRALWRSVTGRVADADLRLGQESEDLAQLETAHLSDDRKDRS